MDCIEVCPVNGGMFSVHKSNRAGCTSFISAPDRPPPPQPHVGHAAGGAGSRGAARARNGHTTALFATKCQSFLDNVIASLAQVGAWNDLPATPTPLTIPGPDMARWR